MFDSLVGSFLKEPRNSSDFGASSKPVPGMVIAPVFIRITAEAMLILAQQRFGAVQEKVMGCRRVL
jgi:hypothetical protein